MVPMRAQLIPLDGAPAVELNKDLTLVGRKEECDLCLHHKSVSKMHCIIVRTDGLLLLRDLGSTNGTRVNGLRVRRAALLPNDQLAIAGFKFRVHFGPHEAAALGSDRTQQLEPQEVAELLKAPKKGNSGGTSKHEPAPVQQNPLPDVYSEHDTGKG